jgi:beta-lactam-binding protein with PASTA domain
MTLGNKQYVKEYVMGAVAAVVLSVLVVLMLIGTFVVQVRQQRNVKRPAVSGTESDRDSINQRAA